jgi:hypothetical protein
MFKHIFIFLIVTASSTSERRSTIARKSAKGSSETPLRRLENFIDKKTYIKSTSNPSLTKKYIKFVNPLTKKYTMLFNNNIEN